MKGDIAWTAEAADQPGSAWLGTGHLVIVNVPRLCRAHQRVAAGQRSRGHGAPEGCQLTAAAPCQPQPLGWRLLAEIDSSYDQSSLS